MRVCLSVLCLATILTACAESGPHEDTQAPQNRDAPYLDFAAFPAERISEYNLFRDPARQVPTAGVVPYDLNTPHFADYATLHRFLWIPEGKAIAYKDDHSLEYPTGAVIILTVGYLKDFRDPELGEQIVETRIFLRAPNAWRSFQYIWNQDATDARLAPQGGDFDVAWLDKAGERHAMTYHVPNANQCKMCHRIDDIFQPLGPVKAAHLNKVYPYEHGVENQLAYWSRIGFLDGAPKSPGTQAPRMARWDDPSAGSIDERARAYLDINCSSCHRPGGLAWTSGLDLRYDQKEPVRFGVFKAPVAAGRGVGTARFGIVPGDPSGSILMHRISSTDPGIRMPAVGRGLLHREGTALIQEWIAQLEYPELSAAQRRTDEGLSGRRLLLQPQRIATQYDKDARGIAL